MMSYMSYNFEIIYKFALLIICLEIAILFKNFSSCDTNTLDFILIAFETIK